MLLPIQYKIRMFVCDLINLDSRVDYSHEECCANVSNSSAYHSESTTEEGHVAKIEDSLK